MYTISLLVYLVLLMLFIMHKACIIIVELLSNQNTKDMDHTFLLSPVTMLYYVMYFVNLNTY